MAAWIESSRMICSTISRLSSVSPVACSNWTNSCSTVWWSCSRSLVASTIPPSRMVSTVLPGPPWTNRVRHRHGGGAASSAPGGPCPAEAVPACRSSEAAIRSTWRSRRRRRPVPGRVPPYGPSPREPPRSSCEVAGVSEDEDRVWVFSSRTTGDRYVHMGTSNSHETFDLVVVSHLRWGWVYQRPQHILSRFATDHRVLYVEEPLPSDGQTSMQVSRMAPAVWAAVPRIDAAVPRADWPAVQANLLHDLLEQHRIGRNVLWY